MRRAGIVLAMAAAACAFGQGNPDEMQRVRAAVRMYLDQLPLITCTEDTRQTVGFAGAGSTETREDSCDTHAYKLFSLQSAGILADRVHEPNRKRPAVDWHEPLSDASLGTSTSFLAALVDPQADAGLRLVRTGKFKGRAVSVYAFHAAAPEGLLLADATGSVRVPFIGQLIADAATGALVWVQIQCIDVPSASEYIGADVTVDFRPFDVAGHSISLPSHSRVHLRTQHGTTTNEADYSAYRLATFDADSDIQFGDEVPEEKR